MYSNYQYELFRFLKIIIIILMEISNAKMCKRKTLFIFQTLFYMHVTTNKYHNTWYKI